MKFRSAVFAALALPFLAGPLAVFGQTNISLLRDINPVGGSNPIYLTPTDSHLFFLADDGLNDQPEFWATDGQPGGSTKLVKNLFGIFDEFNAAWPFGERLLFVKTMEGQSPELWVSDASEAGTFKIAVLSDLGFLAPPALVRLGDKAVLTLADKIWLTDGTPAGTFDVSAWVSGQNFSPGNLTATADGLRAFFSITFSPDSAEVWTTDGTSAGTRRVFDLAGSAFPEPKNFFAFQDKMYFAAAGHDSEGLEIRASDGTPGGTVLVKSLSDSVGFLQNMVAAGEQFFFKFVPLNGPNPLLWRSDGTETGTFPLDLLPQGTVLGFGGLTEPLGELLIFDAFNGPENELWATDGSPAGTLKLQIFPALGGLTSSAKLGGKLWFFNDEISNARHLWSTDGTPGGTSKTASVTVEEFNSYELTAFQSRLFFVAYDPSQGQELWSSDGTETGTAIFADLRKSGDAAPVYFTPAGGKLFFVADDHAHSRELWATEGGAATTHLVKDIFPGTFAASPRYLTELDGNLLFAAEEANTGGELWRSDGTAQGTQIVREISPGPSSGRPTGLTKLNGKVFFAAWTAQKGIEAWSTDGTEAGTQLLKDIAPGPQGSAPRNFVPLGGKLFFTARGGQLWATDGTEAGTVLVKIMSPSTNETTAWPGAQALNGKIYQWVRNTGTGLEPWVSDGTNAGTFLLEDLKPGPQGSYPTDMKAFGGQVWFAIENTPGLPPDGNLWRTDGTTGGTALFTTSEQPDGFPGVYNMLVFNGKLFFSTIGGQIWATDGTPENTRLVADLPTDDRFSVFFLADYGGWLWFAGFETEAGIHLWRTDGALTEKVVPPFATAENPLGVANLADVLVFEGALWFTARFDENGAELYKLTLDDSGLPVVTKVICWVSLSPNPASEGLRISNPDFEKGTWSLREAGGAVVRSERFLGEAERSVSVSGLMQGSYFWEWTAVWGDLRAAGKLLIVK